MRGSCATLQAPRCPSCHFQRSVFTSMIIARRLRYFIWQRAASDAIDMDAPDWTLYLLVRVHPGLCCTQLAFPVPWPITLMAGGMSWSVGICPARSAGWDDKWKSGPWECSRAMKSKANEHEAALPAWLEGQGEPQRIRSGPRSSSSGGCEAGRTHKGAKHKVMQTSHETGTKFKAKTMHVDAMLAALAVLLTGGRGPVCAQTAGRCGGWTARGMGPSISQAFGSVHMVRSSRCDSRSNGANSTTGRPRGGDRTWILRQCRRAGGSLAAARRSWVHGSPSASAMSLWTPWRRSSWTS